jgi:hypothetical protein
VSVVRDKFDGAVVVAVAVVRVMELAVDEVIGVVSVGNGFVAAVGTVGVFGAGGVGGTGGRIGSGDGDGRLVDMVAVGSVEVAVVNVGDFFANFDGGMAATFAVDVGMAAVNGVVRAHGRPLFSVATGRRRTNRY